MVLRTRVGPMMSAADDGGDIMMRFRGSGFGGISAIIKDITEKETVIDKKAQHIMFRRTINRVLQTDSVEKDIAHEISCHYGTNSWVATSFRGEIRISVLVSARRNEVSRKVSVKRVRY
jgi:hypothetical protein